MTHQTATVANTAAALTALETFAATYAGYTVHAGVTPSKGHSSNTHWDSVTSRIYRKTGYADIHIAYADGLITEKNAGGSTYTNTYGIIRAAIDADAIGGESPITTYVWSNSSWYDGSSYPVYDCPDACCSPASGATKYHFFTDGTEIFVALQLGTYGWTHFSFGVLGHKAGTWEGGSYFCATNGEAENATALADVSHTAHNWFVGPSSGDSLSTRDRGTNMILHIENGSRKYGINFGGSVADTPSQTYLTDIATPFGGADIDVMTKTLGTLRTANQYNGRTVGIPFDLFGYDPNTLTYKNIGAITGMRLVNIEYLSDEEIINGDWMVFPLGTRTNPNANYCVDTGNYGVAYKRYSLSS